MDKRKIACILIIDGWTCVKGAGVVYPLWSPQDHYDYMVDLGSTDIIIASNDVKFLKKINTAVGVNTIAALGWSGVFFIQELFEFGYSKVFLGGANRGSPSDKERIFFNKMLHIYGSSSFGYTLHFQEKIDLVGMEFLSNFNEILLIEDSLQLMENKEKIDEYILMLNKSKSLKNIEVNICTLFLNYKYWNQGFYKNVNYVNYCEHGVSKLKW